MLKGLHDEKWRDDIGMVMQRQATIALPTLRQKEDHLLLTELAVDNWNFKKWNCDKTD